MHTPHSDFGYFAAVQVFREYAARLGMDAIDKPRRCFDRR